MHMWASPFLGLRLVYVTCAETGTLEGLGLLPGADRAQSIFGIAGYVWAMVLCLVPTIKKPCAILRCTWGAQLI